MGMEYFHEWSRREVQILAYAWCSYTNKKERVLINMNTDISKKGMRLFGNGTNTTGFCL